MGSIKQLLHAARQRANFANIYQPAQGRERHLRCPTQHPISFIGRNSGRITLNFEHRPNSASVLPPHRQDAVQLSAPRRQSFVGAQATTQRDHYSEDG